jgi:hypothetical protein
MSSDEYPPLPPHLLPEGMRPREPWASAPLPGGAQLKIRDVERGQVLVSIEDAGNSYGIGLLPEERQAAAEAVAGNDYVVVARSAIEELRGQVDELTAQVRRRGPFEYEEPRYSQDDLDKARGLGNIGL